MARAIRKKPQLHPKLKKELVRMKEAGIIKKIRKPKRVSAKKTSKPTVGVAQKWEINERGGKIQARLVDARPMTEDEINVAMASEIKKSSLDNLSASEALSKTLAAEIAAEQTRLEELRKNKIPLKFQVPLKTRVEESKSDLYVVWAMEHLQDLNKFRRKLERYSRFPVDNSRNVIVREMQRLLIEYPAYLEAAARLFVGQSVQENGDGLYVEGELHAPEWDGLIK